MYDYGNIVNNPNKKEARNRAIKNAIEKSKIPIFLGGDHFITYPILENYDTELTIIQLDAHSDYLDDENCLHGSVMRLVNDLPNVNKIIHYGLRGNLNSKKDIDYSVKRGNVVILQKEIDKHQKEISDYLEKGSPVYISFDTDFLDPSIAFATGYPEPGGASYNQAKEALMNIMEIYDVKGIDMVEYDPDKDHNQITGNNLVNLIIEMMSVKNKEL